MKILMGTQNPGKIEGAKQAFEKYFETIQIEGVSVDSEVGEEPLNEQMIEGAKNRVRNLKKYAAKKSIDADFYIASEAGLTNCFGEWMDFNLALIENKDGEQSIGCSAGFVIPEKYVDEVIQDNLGNVMDKIFQGTNLNKGNGGIGNLTHGEISRIDLTAQAFIMALVKFINGEIWR